MQRADAWSADVTPERYLERCELKTASLFAAACRLGALLGDAPDGARDALARRSAAASAWPSRSSTTCSTCPGPAERTGKQRGTDLLDGTVTLPLIIARERDPELRAMDLRELVTEPAQAEAVCDRIAATGALGEARERGAAPRGRGQGGLSADLELPRPRRSALDLVADGVVERYA